MWASMKRFLALLFLAVALPAQLIPLDSKTIQYVFKHKRGGFLLLLGDDEQESLAFGSFARFVLSNPHLPLITAVSRREDGTGLFQEVAKEIGVKGDQTPHIIFINSEGTTFKFDSTLQFNPDNIAQFFNRAQNGELPPFIKSQPIPTQKNGFVTTLVGSDFDQFVFKTEKEVLVKFYAPWCHHCKVMASEYQRAAYLLSSNPNVVIAEIDASANQVRSVAVQGFPTIKLWRKDKTKPSIEFHGQRSAENFVQFVKQNTEYEWLQAGEGEGNEDFQRYSDWEF